MVFEKRKLLFLLQVIVYIALSNWWASKLGDWCTFIFPLFYYWDFTVHM